MSETDYLPLEVGNYWTYNFYPVPYHTDHARSYTISIDSSSIINGKEYFYFGNSELTCHDQMLLRYENDGILYGYNTAVLFEYEEPFIRFDLPDSTLKSPSYSEDCLICPWIAHIEVFPEMPIILEIDETDPKYFIDSTFINTIAKEVEIYNNCCDCPYEIMYFIKGIGLCMHISIIGGWEVVEYSVLKQAKINGKLYKFSK